MRKCHSWAVLLPLFSATSFISVATAAESDETLVITANRFEQPVSSVLAPLTIMDREEIETSQARSVTELLSYLPGIEITNNGGKGQNSSIHVRGTNSSHVLVLVDGVRIASATLGTANLGLLPTSMIERIEYIRGPRAAIYGSDAIGGVISIITKPDDKASLYQLSVGGGGDHAFNVGWRSYTEISDQTQLQFNYSQEGAEGYNVKQGSNPDDNHGYQSQTLLAGLDHQFNQYLSTGFKGITNTGYVQYEGYNSAVGDFGANELTRSDRDNWQLAANVALDLKLFQSLFEVSRNSQITDESPQVNEGPTDRFATLRDSFSWINTFDIADAAVINLGYDWLKDDVSASSKAYELSSRINKAIFTTVHGATGPVMMEASARSDDNEQYGRHNTWSVAAGWQVLEPVQLTASVGTAFKAPTFNDLYWPASPWSSGNPDLRPEESQTAELGINGQHVWLHWAVNAYINNIDNLISWVPDENFFYSPENVSEAEIKGLEFEFAFDTGPLTHKLVADLMDPKDVTNDSQLINRSKQNYKWQGELLLNDWSLGLDYLYRGKRYSDVANTQELSSYSLWVLTSSYQFTEAFVLRARIENLFDKQYEPAKGYHSQDRIGYINASYQF